MTRRRNWSFAWGLATVERRFAAVELQFAGAPRPRAARSGRRAVGARLERRHESPVLAVLQARWPIGRARSAGA